MNNTVQLVVGRAMLNWRVGTQTPQWSIGARSKQLITRSVLDTEDLTYPVAFVVGGVAQNPTGFPVAFAFMPSPADANPGSGDWQTGQWVSSGTGTYSAQVLVGPANGGVVLTTGLYNVWVRITGSPEVPIRQLDLLSLI